MNESQFKIELLPNAEFLITLRDGQKVKGRFSMYALDRFAESKKLDSYFQVLTKITFGMQIKEYAELILYGLEDLYRRDTSQCVVNMYGKPARWTEELVMDLVLDEMGGLGTDEAGALFKHAVGRLNKIVDPEPEEPADQKKRKARSKPIP